MATPLVIALAKTLLASGKTRSATAGIMKAVETKHITSRQVRNMLEKLRNPEANVTKEVLSEKDVKKLMKPAAQTRPPGSQLPPDWNTFLKKSGVGSSGQTIREVITTKLPGKFPKDRLRAKEKERARAIVLRENIKYDIASLPKPKEVNPKNIKKVPTEEQVKERAKALEEMKAEGAAREKEIREWMGQREAKDWLEEAKNPVVGGKSIYQKIADAHDTKNESELNRLLNELFRNEDIAAGRIRVQSTKRIPKHSSPEPNYGSTIDEREYARAKETWEEKDFTKSKFRLQDTEEVVIAKNNLESVADDFSSINAELRRIEPAYFKALKRFTPEERRLIHGGAIRFPRKQEPAIHNFQKLTDMKEELAERIAYYKELASAPARAAARDAEHPFYSSFFTHRSPSKDPIKYFYTVSGKRIEVNQGLKAEGYRLQDPIKYFYTASGKRIQINEGRKWTPQEIKAFYKKEVKKRLAEFDAEQKRKLAIRSKAVKKKAEIAGKKADEKAGIVREKPNNKLMTKEEYETSKKSVSEPGKKTNTTTDSSQARPLTPKEREEFLAKLFNRNLPLG